VRSAPLEPSYFPPQCWRVTAAESTTANTPNSANRMNRRVKLTSSGQRVFLCASRESVREMQATTRPPSRVWMIVERRRIQE